ncbi:MAG: hypothetical protein ACYC0Q_06980 [Eubacteriales bacterium]
MGKMLERLIGLAVITGLITSFVGAFFGLEKIKTYGNMSLLVIATLIVYYLLRFHLLNPTREITGVCLSKTSLTAGYLLKFKTGNDGVFSGESNLKQGDRVQIGDKALLKVKGKHILEINRLDPHRARN